MKAHLSSKLGTRGWGWLSPRGHTFAWSSQIQEDSAPSTTVLVWEGLKATILSLCLVLGLCSSECSGAPLCGWHP